MTAKLPPLSIRAWLRFAAMRSFLEKFGPGARVLEIGTGLGGVGCRLALRFDYTGLDLDRASASVAAERLARLGVRGHVVNGDLSALAPGARFDLVCAFEVLEHIEDDRGALAEWSARLVPGGALLISVPAFQKRFSRWDVRAGHFRRYERDEISAKLRDAGFVAPELRTYGFPIDFALESVRNTAARVLPMAETNESRTAMSGRFLQPPDGAGWLTRGVSAPFRVAQRPFFGSKLGTGLVVFARTPA